ncbi:hypothetical protein SNEBB_009323 [Seison nebaliae]|nr:hypothetical protein SNEBB_009323 [Seison nebaliae]
MSQLSTHIEHFVQKNYSNVQTPLNYQSRTSIGFSIPEIVVEERKVIGFMNLIDLLDELGQVQQTSSSQHVKEGDDRNRKYNEMKNVVREMLLKELKEHENIQLLLEWLNVELATNTYLCYQSITTLDLLLFIYLYKHLRSNFFNDSTKYVHLYRWAHSLCNNLKSNGYDERENDGKMLMVVMVVVV